MDNIELMRLLGVEGYKEAVEEFTKLVRDFDKAQEEWLRRQKDD